MLLVALASVALLGQSPALPPVSQDRLKATVEKLASWHDRNTNNPTLTEAAEWIAAELRKVPRLQVELMKYPIERAQRIPEAKEVVQVVATLPGETDRRIIIGGHMDTINMREQDLTAGRSPGANDDGSGTALTMELARIMAARTWKHTLMFVCFSGEEQGLLGSRALARRAKAEGWKIDAVLNNDIVGNSRNNIGQSNSRDVRVFSEESLPSSENPHRSRELARFIHWLAQGKRDVSRPLLVFRPDRFGRGGDHTPFNREGFNAVRFTEVHEEYERQHNDKDLPEFVDYRYLANNTRLNLLVASTLAEAGTPPENVRIDRRQGQHTTLTWRSTPGTRYVVYWRATTNPVWQKARQVGEATTVTLEKVHKDDHIFAVGAVNGIPVEAR